MIRTKKRPAARIVTDQLKEEAAIRRWLKRTPEDRMRKLTAKEIKDKEKIEKELLLQLEEFPENIEILKNLIK